MALKFSKEKAPETEGGIEDARRKAVHPLYQWAKRLTDASHQFVKLDGSQAERIPAKPFVSTGGKTFLFVRYGTVRQIDLTGKKQYTVEVGSSNPEALAGALIELAEHVHEGNADKGLEDAIAHAQKKTRPALKAARAAKAK